MLQSRKTKLNSFVYHSGFIKGQTPGRLTVCTVMMISFWPGQLGHLRERVFFFSKLIKPSRPPTEMNP